VGNEADRVQGWTLHNVEDDTEGWGAGCLIEAAGAFPAALQRITARPARQL
jgi:hypothetical protein